jgi:ornithine carbamoyltransferase
MAAVYPMHLSIACPSGYAPDRALLERAQSAGISTIEVVDDPRIAADSADAIYTDVWTSMGQEAESNVRKDAFKKFQVNNELLRLANPNALVMHCLPAHRGEEITADALESANSVIFDQAENRLHIQKAVLVTLLAPEFSGLGSAMWGMEEQQSVFNAEGTYSTSHSSYHAQHGQTEAAVYNP